MRLNYQHLAAIGLLIVCAFLIIRQSGGKTPAPGPNPVISSSPTELPSHAVALPSPSPLDVPAATAEIIPEANLESKNPGMRLADNVPLPAVIIDLNTTMKDPERKIPQPIRDAMQAIVDTFYQDLAASVRDQPVGASGPTAKTADDNTIVIEPGPAVDRARATANETYRALFGDAAYNRMTMNALLESKLPATTGN